MVCVKCVKSRKQLSGKHHQLHKTPFSLSLLPLEGLLSDSSIGIIYNARNIHPDPPCQWWFQCEYAACWECGNAIYNHFYSIPWHSLWRMWQRDGGGQSAVYCALLRNSLQPPLSFFWLSFQLILLPMWLNFLHIFIWKVCIYLNMLYDTKI